MVWSTIKFVPQKYHNYAVISSENSLNQVIVSEKKNAVRRLNAKVDEVFDMMTRM